MIYLSDKATGRDNNLNLIRAVAATAVLVSHGWSITRGYSSIQPLEVSTGHSLGTLSVYVFFAISGFLISMSFERSSSMTSFLTARVLRLFPGLFVSLIFVAFILGPAVTTLNVGAYLTNSEIYMFMVRNLTLYDVQYRLPGVFEQNPFDAVEGSIWTLFFEVICYMGAFTAGILGILARRSWMALSLCAYLAAWLVVEASGITGRVNLIQSLSLPFIIGMGFYVWRDRLPLSFWGIVLLAALAWGFRDTVIYDLLLSLALAYGTFWLAYVPGGFVRRYNQIGDYSYGIYIYAIPLQGLAYWFYGPQEPLTNILLSFPMTLIAAIASWHLIEKPAMETKPQVMALLGKPARVV